MYKYRKDVFALKKITVIITAVVMTLIATNCGILAKADSPVSRDILKVGLFYASTGKGQVTLQADSGLVIGYEDNYIFYEEYEADKNEMVFTLNDNGEMLEYGSETAFDANKKLAIYPKDGVINVDSKPYRGGIELLYGGDGITVINLVSTDDYVKGVIAREMPSHWAIEALKAQAVCARNYAVTSLNKHSSYGFDLCDNTNCQVYGGVNAETESTIRAADETSGVYLMYDGGLAETLFYSCNGGYTSESKYVWGSHIPYLIAKEDIYENEEECSKYNWHLTFTADEIKEKLSATGVEIGDIIDVEITDTTESNQVYGLKITGTDGEKTYVNDKVRGALGSGVLLSQRYTVDKAFESNTEYVALTADGKAVPCKLLYAYGADKTNTAINTTPSVISANGTSTMSMVTSAYTFNGHGWGHGLGMSQYGAKGMADKGHTYDEILEFYYTGTYLEGESLIENQ